MKISNLILLFCLLHVLQLNSQSQAELLIDKSIAFHDPKSNWQHFQNTLSFSVERPDRPDGKRKVFLDNKQNKFSFWAQYEEGLLFYGIDEGKKTALWNNNREIPAEFEKKYRISEDRIVMYRDYYSYLYGMPMKLKDSGTIIHPEVESMVFYGKTLDRVKVNYDPAVGDDTWYFYFNQDTHALEAYQFFHDEAKHDGEYILFEELLEIQGIKIPRIRNWYYNIDNKFLAADILLK